MSLNWFTDDDDDDDAQICRARPKWSSDALSVPVKQVGLENRGESVTVRRAAGRLFQMCGPATAKLCCVWFQCLGKLSLQSPRDGFNLHGMAKISNGIWAEQMFR